MAKNGSTAWECKQSPICFCHGFYKPSSATEPPLSPYNLKSPYVGLSAPEIVAASEIHHYHTPVTTLKNLPRARSRTQPVLLLVLCMHSLTLEFLQGFQRIWRDASMWPLRWTRMRRRLELHIGMLHWMLSILPMILRTPRHGGHNGGRGGNFASFSEGGGTKIRPDAFDRLIQREWRSDFTNNHHRQVNK